MSELCELDLFERDFNQLDESAVTMHQCSFRELANTDPSAAYKLLAVWFETCTRNVKVRDGANGNVITEKDDGVEAARGAMRQLFDRNGTEPFTMVIRIRRDLNLLKWLVTKDKVETIIFDVEPPNLAF